MFNSHHCELSKGSDFTSPKSGNFLFSRLRSWITIYEGHPKCREHLISLAAANKEKQHHASLKHGLIIHPFSKIRLFWEIIMMIVYFIAFITIPFLMCFLVLDYKTVHLDKINPAIYAFCWVDIFSNCITGFYDQTKNEVVLDQGKILKRYFRSYMFIDIFTSLPYDHITLPWRRVPGPEDSFIVTIFNLVPILKLSRYFTFTSYIRQIFLYFGSDDNMLCQMCLTLLLYTYFIHWFTCFCNVTPLIMMFAQHIPVNESEDIWLAKINGIAHRYQQALFIVLENFTASGYGVIKPKSEGHIAVCTLLMVLGRLFESYIIIMLLQIVADRSASQSKYEQILNQLKAYARQKQLPAYMKQRLLAYYCYRFRNSYFREKKILANLSSWYALREEVILHSCRRLVENVEIFQNLPKNILTLIVANLKTELYLAKDMIIKAGTQGDCMFFLSSGTVAILTPTGKEVCFLEDGAHFGEVALLVQDQRRVASVVAVEVCEVYRLDRKDFRKCIAVHSDLFAKMERIATERIQRTVLVEEQHKRFTMHSRASSIAQMRKAAKNKISTI